MKAGGTKMPQMSIVFIRVVHKPQLALPETNEPPTFRGIISRAIDPDVTTSRYNRTWRVSQPKTRDDDFLVGKLGFTAMASEKRTYYDIDLKDFVEQAQEARQGHYTGWAIDLSSQMMAFETRLPDIRPQSFVGALRGLLDERPEYALTAEYVRESAKFFEWVKPLDRITKFTAKLRAPNPDFASRPQIVRMVLERTNADHATVEVTTDRDGKDSLSTGDTIKDLVDYGEEGYSDIIAWGLKDGESKVFDSRRKVATERVDIRGTPDIDTVWEYLISALRKHRK
ncbi:MAG: hypothetical protein Q8O40_16590 [Chloroflexota bacterium]|nr:hypothetical protein [Chloroflexota bacterium]